MKMRIMRYAMNMSMLLTAYEYAYMHMFSSHPGGSLVDFSNCRYTSSSPLAKPRHDSFLSNDHNLKLRRVVHTFFSDINPELSPSMFALSAKKGISSTKTLQAQ